MRHLSGGGDARVLCPDFWFFLWTSLRVFAGGLLSREEDFSVLEGGGGGGIIKKPFVPLFFFLRTLPAVSVGKPAASALGKASPFASEPMWSWDCLPLGQFCCRSGVYRPTSCGVRWKIFFFFLKKLPLAILFVDGNESPFLGPPTCGVH